MKKRLLSMFMAILMVFTILTPSTAQAKTTQINGNVNFLNNIYIEDYLDQDDKNYLNKLTKVFDEFSLNDSGILEINKPLNEIQEKAGFTDSEMDRFNEIFTFSKNYPTGITSSKTMVENASNSNNIIEPNVFVEDWKIYFTLDEVQMYFFAAAQIGPAAIIAALAGLGTSIGGPVGTAIGTVVGYVSGAAFAYLVLRAVSLGKGVYIGLEWDGIFPVFVDGTW